jgi:type IV pilus assembly protein PilP
MKRSIRSLLAALVASSLGVGCSDSPPPPGGPGPASSTPARAPVAPPSSAPMAEQATYAYNPVGKRDPFRSPAEEALAPSNLEASACNEPLCQWSLDQLTLVAVVTGDSNPVAMVEDPQGQGFIVRPSTKMGKQGGRVTNILRDSIIVTEFWQRPDSKERVPNPVTMKLHADSKETASMDLISGKLVQ